MASQTALFTARPWNNSKLVVVERYRSRKGSRFYHIAITKRKQNYHIATIVGMISITTIHIVWDGVSCMLFYIHDLYRSTSAAFVFFAIPSAFFAVCEESYDGLSMLCIIQRTMGHHSTDDVIFAKEGQWTDGCVVNGWMDWRMGLACIRTKKIIGGISVTKKIILSRCWLIASLHSNMFLPLEENPLGEIPSWKSPSSRKSVTNSNSFHNVNSMISFAKSVSRNPARLSRISSVDRAFIINEGAQRIVDANQLSKQERNYMIIESGWFCICDLGRVRAASISFL